MGYFSRQEVENAIKDLDHNKKLPLEQARENGWQIQIDPKYGLTIWVKDFKSFTLSEDRGGQRGLSQDGSLVCNFYSLKELEENGWVETIPQLALARGK